MVTITITARATQILFHRRILHPLCTSSTVLFSPSHRKNLYFSPLPTQILNTYTSSSSSSSSSCKPLFCSIKETVEFDTFQENEETQETKVCKFKEKEAPKLTVKEIKVLCSYANSLGDKLKCQQVGKSGVTENSVFAFSETLEANEFLKLKIHRTCPGELEDVVKQLERATGSVVVGQIGRTVIFYRPSITKLEAEKKREHDRKLFAQKREKSRATFMKREQVTRRTGRGQFTNRRSEKTTS